MTAFDAAVLDFVEHPVFVLQPGDDGLPRYIAFNTFARAILNKPLDAIMGRTAQELYPGRLGRIAFEHHCDALKSGESRVYEIQLPVAVGQKLVRTTLRPELDNDGNVTRIFGSSLDISGQQIFREMQTEVDTMSSEMENFINLAAHDLRAPMRNVKLVAEMLREDFQDMGDGKLELIDLLEDMGEKAMRLIGDVLAHAEAASAIQQTTEFEFGALVQEIMALLDPMGQAAIQFDDAMIAGDRTATQIILRNLIDNAIKNASDNGAFKLRLTIRVETAGAKFVKISVQDNGSGFSNPALAFLDNGKARTDSGFGLLGVRRLIHARGGTILVTNRSSTTGAKIQFSLPGTIAMSHAGVGP